MEQDYVNTTTPLYQPNQIDLATSEQVSILKTWLMISILTNITTTLVVIGLLIFVYYSLLLEM